MLKTPTTTKVLVGVTVVAVVIAGFVGVNYASCGEPGYGKQVPPEDIIKASKAALKATEDNPNIPENVKAQIRQKYEADIARASGKNVPSHQP